MPRKKSPRKRQEWTDLADQGLSVAEIRAREDDRVDPRTIAGAIKEVRAERERHEVRRAALQDSFTSHCRTLVLALTGLREAASTRFAIGPRRPVFGADPDGVTVNGGQAMRRAGAWSVSLDCDRGVEVELLREHLAGDRIWDAVGEYRDAAAGYVAARLSFAMKVTVALEESTGLRVTDGDPDSAHLTSVGVALIDESCARAGTDRSEDVAELVELLAVGPDGDGLWTRGTLVVRGWCPASEAESSQMAAAVAAGVARVRGSAEWRALLSADARVARAQERLRREIAVLEIGGFLPGECGACARYWR